MNEEHSSSNSKFDIYENERKLIFISDLNGSFNFSFNTDIFLDIISSNFYKFNIVNSSIPELNLRKNYFHEFDVGSEIDYMDIETLKRYVINTFSDRRAL